MSHCAGIKADGGRCGAQAIRGSEWCFNHHPDYEEQRRRRASKGGNRGGRGRPAAEIAGLKQRLSDLADGVLLGTHDRADAAVAGQLLNYCIRALGMELKIKEVEELERRLEQLEEGLERHRATGGGMGLRNRLGQLERAYEGEKITIPQQDGSIAKFPKSAAADAYVNVMARLRAGEDAPPEHPLLEAARNSSDSWWRRSVYAVDEDWTAPPVPDLSE